MMETREAIHIKMVNPPLNRNLGKIDIPKVLGEVIGIKQSNITSYQASTVLAETVRFRS